MKIAAIEAIIVKIPGVYPMDDQGTKWITKDYFVLDKELAVVYSRNMETVFVKVTTDDGLIGWGEVLAPTSPEVAATLIETALAPILIGENPMDTQVLWEKLYNMYRVRGYDGGFLLDAMAGLDIAFWDIRGKALSSPCYALMGGAYRKEIPAYISTIKGTNVSERMDCIRALVEQGNKAIKLHAVGDGWRDALEMLRAIRVEFSVEKLRVMHDGHWNYTLGEARKFGECMDELDLEFFECPLKPEDLLGHVKLAKAINTPIALGESMRGLHTFTQWMEAGAVELIQPDVGRVGITDFQRIATVAHANHLYVAPHLSVHQSVGFLASVHLAAAMPNLAVFEYQPGAVEAARGYSSHSALLKDGFIALPKEPGLGVEMDEKAMEPYVTDRRIIKKQT